MFDRNSPNPYRPPEQSTTEAPTPQVKPPILCAGWGSAGNFPRASQPCSEVA
jgi:hypothetical protein